ncbi:MAG TPA: OmpA family protein, partial [Polyangia bacterium]|nr:OmpA family protein [Polyangia bacterium]
LKPATTPMLDALAVIMKAQTPQFPLLALEGHAADNEQSPMKLSLARASALRVALIARGVDEGRLIARASGSSAPACAQRTETCWRRERTVEFITLPGAKAASPSPETETAEAASPHAPEAKPAVADRAAPPIPLERIAFKKSSAVLEPSALADLDLLAGFMKTNSVSLEIVGYADERERDAAALAAARAGAVKKYMMACGVQGASLIVRAERTGRAACRSHSAKCSARDGRAELRFLEPQAP